jgi:hypothetical protein
MNTLVAEQTLNLTRRFKAQRERVFFKSCC